LYIKERKGGLKGYVFNKTNLLTIRSMNYFYFIFAINFTNIVSLNLYHLDRFEQLIMEVLLNHFR